MSVMIRNVLTPCKLLYNNQNNNDNNSYNDKVKKLKEEKNKPIKRPLRKYFTTPLTFNNNDPGRSSRICNVFDSLSGIPITPGIPLAEASLKNIKK